MRLVFLLPVHKPVETVDKSALILTIKERECAPQKDSSASEYTLFSKRLFKNIFQKMLNC